MSQVPDILVERLRLGELSATEAAAVRARLEAAGELHRLDALEADDHATLRAHPRLALPPQPKLAPHSSRRWAIPALVALVVALFFVSRPSTTEDWLRAKGDVRPALLVYRQTAGGYEVLHDGDHVEVGDTLQLAYVAAGRQVGAIVSVDGRGTTTVHVPVGVLQQGGEVRLPKGYVLDDAPDYERFVLITLDTGLELTTVTVRK